MRLSTGKKEKRFRKDLEMTARVIELFNDELFCPAERQILLLFN